MKKIIDLYLRNNASSDTLDYITRFYVYHYEILLEYAIENDQGKGYYNA